MTDLVTDAVALLRRQGVTLERGLDDAELEAVESSLDFTFGPDHRRFLAEVLPTGASWPNWRDAPPEELRTRLDWPAEGIVGDVLDGSFWPASWGERPDDPAMLERTARQRLALVPRLVPLYSHRYLAADPAYLPSPVFSVVQQDVTYYGDNLLDYVARESGSQQSHPSPQRQRVPFWSDLAQRFDRADF